MMPTRLPERTKVRFYQPKNAVLRIRELRSKRDVRLFHVRCLNLDREKSLAWEVRVEVRKEFASRYRIFVYSKKSPPKGQFLRLQEIMAQKLDIEITGELYHLDELFDGSLALQRQDYATGKIKNIIFHIEIIGYNKRLRRVEADFIHINNATIPSGEYADIISFLERRTGYRQVARYPQKQFSF